MENFPWTRLEGVVAPSQQKPMVDYDRMKGMGPKDARKLLGDGNFGGYYEKSDDDMMALWNVAVEETRTLIETNWQ
jgi:creatinine amidohydrolase